MNGLLVLVGVVILGLVAGTGFYTFQAPRAKERLEQQLADAPPPEAHEERVRLWLEFAAPQIHGKLVTGRLSAQQPWVVTHTVADAADPDGPPMVWGVPATEFTVYSARTEGSRVIVEVPAPRPITRTQLVGNKAAHVPAFGPEGPGASYPNERMVFLIDFFLAGLAGNLAREIEGAELVVVVRPPAADPGE